MTDHQIPGDRYELWRKGGPGGEIHIGNLNFRVDLCDWDKTLCGLDIKYERLEFIGFLYWDRKDYCQQCVEKLPQEPNAPKLIPYPKNLVVRV